MKDLIAPKPEEGEEGEPSREKVLYYNAFTEDLFYWDNDLLGDPRGIQSDPSVQQGELQQRQFPVQVLAALRDFERDGYSLFRQYDQAQQEQL